MMRGWMYDAALIRLTSGWYREVLQRVPEGATVLDVGIGTAGALIRCADLLRDRDLRVVGVDIDEDYVRRAHRRIEQAGLSDRVRVEHTALQDHAGGPYDAVYFAASFMLFPSPVEALAHARRLLAPGGQVFFTQTFQERTSPMMEKIKPRLRRWTGIDFGSVTYEADFLRTLASASYEVDDHDRLGGNRRRSSRLVVAHPRPPADGPGKASGLGGSVHS